MNIALLHPDIQYYIEQNLGTDPSALILKGIPFDNVSTKDVVEQIEAKKKCEKKLPTWFNHSGIYYPNKLNIEQTSSELTAAYKSKLISGDTLIDLTGGFGVDTYYFAKEFNTVVHCEMNTELSNIVTHNLKILAVENIKTAANDGLKVLKSSPQHYDWIYVDPSRRHDLKGKVFLLSDCLPNIPENLEDLWQRSHQILIKTSPLLDISAALNELRGVKTIHVIAVNNEVKELLFALEKDVEGKIEIQTINLKPDKKHEQFNFILEDERQFEVDYVKPMRYLYEPNAAILKSGGFNSITSTIKVHKLHKHSHLYTSDALMSFPGRTFQIMDVLPFSKKNIKRLNIKKANITTRNFPETVDNLRKSLKIEDGGEIYLFFTTDVDHQKTVLVCSKI